MVIDLNYGEKYRQEIFLKNQLEENISKNLYVPKENVLLNYGSNSNLLLVFSSFSNELLVKKKRKLKLLLDIPNYFFTRIQLKQWNINELTIKRSENFELNIKEFIKSIKKNKPDIILITTPNNPTGKPFKDDEIKSIIKSVPKNTTVLIDRSCVNTLPEISTKQLFKEFPKKRLIMLHSFSKSHALSDERLGFLATNDSKIAEFLTLKRDLNHNIHALRKLKKVLNKKSIPQKKKNTIHKCNLLLEEFCNSRSNLVYYKSHSNFALLKLPNSLDAQTLENHLQKKKILIMPGNKIGLSKNYIRIHMTGVREIKAFVRELSRVLKSHDTL